MELTRRDAVAALAALGAGGTLSGCVAPPGSTPENDGGSAADVDTERIRETMVAAAEVVYPSAVTGTASFVDAFLEGRLEDRSHAVALDATVAELNDLAESWYDDPFPTLAPDDRDRFLREVGADTAAENPDGSARERIRYYVVNDLLLALYTSPTGGELVGLENPQGHPGGLESYQRGPDA
ncbi:gluconate 2-dehydrogenase subunit 3 family protein [Natrinema salsiterrestre]|uniref:Gluconate 2-dehydrogenase subunit 3 family protein n=1 Tax=Natrinema salsiterrestre TaxID=2950540 RepID=A0A9Q4L335_9EURY|nr:gluconate 2-dehydrogenase subunit 3 family protein [Natrinema salsiterrestre]MDF9744446.1 gluconate 2-dehydrogenase subunit 3 family protein [Natrinema salsiterrestre]